MRFSSSSFSAEHRIRLLSCYLRRDVICPGLPLTAIIATTHRCNMTCRMCIRAAMPFDGPNMDFRLFAKIIDEGTPYIRYISLDGPGETTMNPDAFAMIRYARSKGMRVMFSTNASTLDAAMADVILDSGLDMIIFSVNGATPEAYAAVHGAAVYEKIVANIHSFLVRKRERRSAILVAVQMVLLPETSSHAGAFYRQWRRVPGVDLVRVKKDVVCNKAVWQTETGRHPRRRNPCPRLWHGPVYIETNGDVYASPGIMYNAEPVGNIRESRLAEVWNAGPMQALRRAHALGKETGFPACLRCAYPRPRLPLIVAGFLLDPFSVGKLVPWAERLAFWHRLPLFEKHGPDQFKP